MSVRSLARGGGSHSAQYQCPAGANFGRQDRRLPQVAQLSTGSRPGPPTTIAL